MTNAMTAKNAALEIVEKEARAMFRLFGPRVTAADDENFAIRRCDRCSPPAKLYECYICTFTCEERWRYDLHHKINPETCQRYARKWAERFASEV